MRASSIHIVPTARKHLDGDARAVAMKCLRLSPGVPNAPAAGATSIAPAAPVGHAIEPFHVPADQLGLRTAEHGR